MKQQLSKLSIIISNQFGKRRTKWNNYKLFSKTQYFSAEQIKDFQNEKLKKLLTDAYKFVPYYTKLFDNLKINFSDITVDTLNKIPFLSKKIIQEEKGNLLNKKLKAPRVIPNSTSGSSGEKTIFYSDGDSKAMRVALSWRCKKWIGIDLGSKELKIWGARIDVEKSSHLRTRMGNYFSNKSMLSSYKLNAQIILDDIKVINKDKPDYIHAYPSSLYEIAKFIESEKIKIHKLKAILTSGEQLYDWQRELIERVFSTRIFNFYGCREVGLISLECEKHEGLHIMAENIILEVVNKKGENVFDEEGEIVVTDFSNYVFPFIRYKIMDNGILIQKKCSCGRTLPLLKSINGRTFDLIKLINGGSIGATFFTHLFREKLGIKDFRIYQDKIDHINIEYIPENGETNINYFREKIIKHSDNLLNVDFKIVEKFETPDSGKKQFIKSFV